MGRKAFALIVHQDVVDSSMVQGATINISKNKRGLKLIEDGLVHQGNHWVTKYPWIRNPSLLPNNRKVAVKMLENTERRLLNAWEYRKTASEKS